MLVDMKRWFRDLTLNVILRMVAGKRYCGGGADAEETRRCHQVLREFFELAGGFVAADAMPYLGWLDVGGLEKRMKKNAEELDGIVGGWLAEHREKEYSGENQKPEDFMDVMLSVVQSAELQAHALRLHACGGSDTTTVMLVWALSLLLNNRRVLKKAQEELDKHVGRERRVDESDISNLVYLHVIVKETLRLYPAGPLGGTREFTEDSHIGGYHVPKGTWLTVNLWKLQRDPNVWPDGPLEFRPERFLSRGKKCGCEGA
ncbi:UNVERIFIED_CONTAM: cytochrome [Sesamum latifolium]|uniref:Cytochrome n=1 Tax=Sesamum latifolium TaxID=2727402 RepID=A0AAW2XAM7_9LAMI